MISLKVIAVYSIGLLIILLAIGCSKKAEVPCRAIAISAITTASQPCIGQGKIMITSPMGSSWIYKIGNSSFQSSSSFEGLLPATYTIKAKNEAGCVDSAIIIVSEITSGPLFSNIKNLLVINCISCHGGNNPQAGVNFESNCEIINNWQRIKARAVDGNPSPMPQGGLLPLIERNKITNWINAGHRFAD